MHGKFNIFILLISFLVILVSCGEETPPVYADLIILNGDVFTAADSTNNINSIAIKDDTIMALGNASEISELKGPTTRAIDAKSKFVMPGFIDSHLHFISTGKAKLNVELQSAGNWNEVIFEVLQAAQSAGFRKWIVGRGWHQEKWNMTPEYTVEGYPVHDKLSEAVNENPVILQHASGHAIIANKVAMNLAGIDDSTKSPEGGAIIRDYNGKATGVFVENAAELIWKAYYKDNNETDDKFLEQCVKLAQDECLKYGITSVHDAGVSFDILNFYKSLADSGKLNVRINAMIFADSKQLKEWLGDNNPDKYNSNKFLRVGSVKAYIDGALGSRGAWLLEPYSDMPENKGFNVTELGELKNLCNLCAENKLQVCTHAIGDRGIREILDIYKTAFNKHGEGDYRWRIEHAQHIDPSDIKTFASNNVIAAMQGVHCTSDAPFVIKRLGDKRAEKTSYLWRSLLDAGVTICNGTDSPVESVNPFDVIYSSVTRNYGDKTFFPEQSMTIEEALKSYTIAGAYASFEEDVKGSLEVGKLADIIILDNNLLEIDAVLIPETRVEYTISGGNIVYSVE